MRQNTDESRVFDAIAAGDPDAVNRLLAANPSLSLTRATADRLFESIPHWLYAGDTPLHLAAAALQRDIVSALVAHGAEATVTNRRGATALHYACDPRPNLGVWNPAKQAEIIDLLVRAGSPVTLPDRNGATPLHRAVRARSAAAVRALLAHGAGVDARVIRLATTSSGASGTAGTRDEQQDVISALREAGAS